MVATSFLQGSSLRSGVAFKASRASRVQLTVEANKKVQKRTQVILTKDVATVGTEGQLLTVPVGYWRNYLLPNNVARIAGEGVLEAIRQKKDAALRVRLEEKARAQGLADALATIGKFVLKKKAGDKDQIYGSVTKKEVADAVYQQMGVTIDTEAMSLPDIKGLGTFEASVRLHPEVQGTFSVVIQREKQAPPSGKPKRK